MDLRKTDEGVSDKRMIFLTKSQDCSRPLLMMSYRAVASTVGATRKPQPVLCS